MRPFPKISHRQLCNYLTGNTDRHTQEQIDDVRTNDAAYKLLFELIDEIRSQVQISSEPSSRPVSFPFSKVEDVLMNIFTSPLQATEAQDFIENLLSSATFYQRLILKLNQIASNLKVEAIPELNSVEIKSDEHLLKEILESSCSKMPHKVRGREQTTPDSAKSAWQTILEGLNHLKMHPHLVYAGIILIIVGVSIMLFRGTSGTENYTYFVSPNSIPYDYNMSQLRGVIPEAYNNALWESFKSSFLLGMSDYLLQDYENAIQTWKKLEKTTQILENQNNNAYIIPWLRDFYFYLGLSYLALPVKRRLNDGQKLENYQKSIEYISRAKSLAIENNLENSDREIYFEALTYKFAGQSQVAIAQLKRIPPESKFYKDSQKLIRKWSN